MRLVRIVTAAGVAVAEVYGIWRLTVYNNDTFTLLLTAPTVAALSVASTPVRAVAAIVEYANPTASDGRGTGLPWCFNLALPRHCPWRGRGLSLPALRIEPAEGGLGVQKWS